MIMKKRIIRDRFLFVYDLVHKERRSNGNEILYYILIGNYILFTNMRKCRTKKILKKFSKFYEKKINNFCHLLFFCKVE